MPIRGFKFNGFFQKNNDKAERDISKSKEFFRVIATLLLAAKHR